MILPAMSGGRNDKVAAGLNPAALATLVGL